MSTIDVKSIKPMQNCGSQSSGWPLTQASFTFRDEGGRVVSSGAVLPDGSFHTTQGIVAKEDLAELFLRLISHTSIR